jgi:DNA-binding FadR family transcriptional regulator
MFGGIEMTLQNATRQTLADQIVAQMDRMIQSGEWPLRGKIPPEPELVRQLGVSRNTVREAVKALIHTGLLEARQGDGTYVVSTSELGPVLRRKFGKSDLLQTLEVRSALEQEAARLAAERRSEADVAALQLRFGEFCRAARSGNVDSFVQADTALHREIVRATTNSLLMELYDHISEALAESISATADELEEHERVHRRLIESIAGRNAEAAAEAVRDHIRIARQSIFQSHPSEK